MAAPAAASPSGRAVYRAVALPSEHGGWGFTFEPVLLGLLVAPSAAGLAWGVAATAVFLAKRPLRLALGDLRRRRRLSRTAPALVVSAGYVVLGSSAVAGATLLAGFEPWLPLVVAAPLAVVAVLADARTRGRNLVPELAGAMGIAAVAPAIAIAGGRTTALALGLWLVLAGRSLAGVVQARAQVRRARRTGYRMEAVVAAHAAALGAAASGWWGGIVPWTAAAALVVMAGVDAVVLRAPPVPAKVVGLVQLGVGLLVVVATAAGVRLAL